MAILATPREDGPVTTSQPWSLMAAPEDIDSNPFDVRRTRHTDDLEASLTRHGFRGSLLVRPHPDREGRYQLAFGHRRLEAALKVGLPALPVQLDKTLSDDDLLEWAGLENVAREDLTPVEEAHWLGLMRERRALSVRDLERFTGQSRGWIDRRLQILRLPADVQEHLHVNPSTLTAALAVQSLAEGERQRRYFDLLVGGELPAFLAGRELERVLRAERQPQPSAPPAPQPGPSPEPAPAPAPPAPPAPRPAPSPVPPAAPAQPVLVLLDRPAPPAPEGLRQILTVVPPPPLEMPWAGDGDAGVVARTERVGVAGSRTDTVLSGRPSEYGDRLTAWLAEGRDLMDAAGDHRGALEAGVDGLLAMTAALLGEAVQLTADAAARPVLDDVTRAIEGYVHWLNDSPSGIAGNGVHYVLGEHPLEA
jgi:ParB/RepB/Spo0J family partition protein